LNWRQFPNLQSKTPSCPTESGAKFLPISSRKNRTTTRLTEYPFYGPNLSRSEAASRTELPFLFVSRTSNDLKSTTTPNTDLLDSFASGRCVGAGPGAIRRSVVFVFSGSLEDCTAKQTFEHDRGNYTVKIPAYQEVFS
jgi:hypothetical protein